MKHKNWFWGIFFLAAAVFVIASQVGAFLQIGFWSIAATVLLVAVFVSSLAGLNFFGIFISAALLYLIYQQPLNFPELSFWLLLLTAVLASLGFSMIFHRRRHAFWHNRGHSRCGSRDAVLENIDGNDVFASTSFGEACKYLQADSLERARLAVSFGKLSVYFDQVQLSPEGAEAEIDVSFGTMSLFIPKSWLVIDHVGTGLGAVNSDSRNTPSNADAPVLTLTGNVSFGSLDIHYV